MNANGQPPRVSENLGVSTVATRAPSTTELCSDCVVLESSADQSWADFCRTLSKPAFLLADVFSDDSE